MQINQPPNKKPTKKAKPKQAPKKRILISLFILSFILVTLMASGMTVMIFGEYLNTVEWTKIKVGGELSTVPPELAKNYVQAEDLDDLTIWTNLDGAITDIKRDKTLHDSKVAEYEQIYKAAKERQEMRNLNNGDVAKNIENLRLYLDITEAAKTAYTKPNQSVLEPLAHQMERLVLDDNSDVNQAFHKRLQTIGNDYYELQVFMTDTLPLLGTIDNRILTIDRGLTYADTDTIINQIVQKKLTQFTHIDALHQQLISPEWTEILRQNEQLQEYDQWLNQKEIIKHITQADYVDIGSIHTYQDALDLGITVHRIDRENAMIEPHSPIDQILLDGEVLTSGMYVKKGTALNATLHEIYTEIEVPNESTQDTSNNNDTENTTDSRANSASDDMTIIYDDSSTTEESSEDSSDDSSSDVTINNE